MFIKKELYREFNLERNIFLAGFDAPKPAEATTPEKQADTGEAARKDLSPTIKQHREKAEKRIDSLLAMASSGKHKDSAIKIHGRLKAHATQEFNQISKDYDAQRNSIGASFEGTEAAKNIEGEAAKLLEKIDKRVNRGRVYIEHQTLQDTLTDNKKREIIEDYLAKDERTGKPELAPMRKELASMIVDEGIVDFRYGDIDSPDFAKNLDLYFDRIDKYQERIGNQLETRIRNVVDRLLEQAPKAEATGDEITAILKIVDKQNAHFGTDVVPGSHQWQVAETLAKRFDIKFKEGSIGVGKKPEISYATDLMSNPLVVYSAEEFENKISLEISSNQKLRDKDKVKEYDESVDKGTEWLTSKRHRIGSGDTVLNLGKVTDWKEWAGSKEAHSLLRINNYIKRRAKQIEGDKKTEKQTQVEQKKTAEAAKKTKERYDNYLEFAKALNPALKKAEAAGYKEVSDTRKQPDFSKPDYEDLVTLQNADGQTIDIRINKNGVTVKNHDVEHRFNSPKACENIDLVKLTTETRERVEKNREKHGKVRQVLEGLKTRGFDIGYQTMPPNERLAQADYKVPVPKLMIGEHQVGTLTFSEDGKSISILIDGKETKTNEKTLQWKLQSLLPNMKKVAERAQKTQSEIAEQLKQEKVPIAQHEDLPFTPTPKIKGNFADPEALIQIATFNKGPDKKTEAATLYMRTKKDGDKPRDYVLMVDNEEVASGTLDQINKHIKDNHESLAYVTPEQKPEQFEGTPQEKKTQETARNNLKTILTKNFPDLVVEGTEQENYLTKIVKKLPKDSVEMLAKPDFEKKVMTKEGADIIRKAAREVFAEMFGSIEKVDENEVKLINGIEVTINGKQPPLKFSDVFGDQLVRILSMRHEFKAGPKGEVQIKEGSEFVTVDAQKMAAYVPDNLRAYYLKILSGEITKEEATEYETKLVDTEKTMQSAKKVQQAVKTEGLGSPEKMGIGELIGSLGQLYKMFQEAMKTGDWKSLEDGLKDFNEGRNPAQRIKDAKTTYENAVSGIDNLGDLLAMYNQPYKSPQAQKLFDKPEGKTPYRIQLRTSIQERLATELGMGISNMEKKSANETFIEGMRGPNKLRVYLKNDSGRTTIRTEEIKVDTKTGKEYVGHRAADKPVDNLKDLNRILEENIDEGKTPTVAPPPKADTKTPEKKDDKKKDDAKKEGDDKKPADQKPETKK